MVSGISGASRKLRVVLVTSSYNYIRDGVALTLNRLVEYLERHDVEVLVIAPVAKVPALTHVGNIVPVPSIPLPRRPEYRLALGLPRSVQKQMIEFKPDIIHVAVPDLLGYRALKFAQKWNIPVVASYHTRYETYLQHYGVGGLRKPLGKYLRNFYDKCRELYVASASMIEELEADGVQTKIRLWTRGVDSELFNPGKRSESWRHQLGFGTEEPVIAFVGRLVREKRLGTFVDTLRRLQESGVTHRALMVGDGPERETLKKQLPDAVYTGMLEGEDLARAYASADIFLFPSDTESFGSVTLEAMASGLPTVCADATGSRSLVDVGSTGFLAKPGDVEAFTGHVRMLAEDAELRRRMGNAARERSLSLSWDDAMSPILGYYKQLVATSD
jgi:phosphatidylinositol alpha 1,6-mannosyltransferase